MSGIRFLEHTADVGIEVTAPDPAALFRATADGMFRLLLGPDHAGPDTRAAVEERRIVLHAPDIARLLVSWLSELLYLYERDGLVPVDTAFPVLEAERLDARVTLVAAAAAPLREIKGVTYHQLDVRATGGAWQARVIFDV